MAALSRLHRKAIPSAILATAEKEIEMAELRFGVLVLPDAPLSELERRWRTVEQWGFDAVYVADHSRDYRNLQGHWFDGWTVLALMAQATTAIRIGTLVTNPILRSPLLTAKAAVTVDHISGGRLELGIGTGIAPFDHAAAGVPYWPAKERVERYREYVEVLDGLLRSASRAFSYEGRYHRASDVALVPPPVQQPRPPIIIGGQSPTVRRVAAARGDGWNTHGPFGLGVDDILEVTARQNRELDEWCVELGRDPGVLRRSLLLFDALDPWGSPDLLAPLVERFAAVGMQEFIVFWPDSAEQLAVFDKVAADVLSRLRG